MAFSKKTLWFKLLALLLVCGMVMGCFVGCDSETLDDDDDDDRRSSKDADELREDLDEYEWNGLVFYLDDDMEESYYEEYGAYYTHEDDDISVMVDGFWVEDELPGDVTSAKKLMEAYLEQFGENEEFQILETDKYNGTYYAHCAEEDITGVIGFYYRGGFSWTITVIYEDDDLEETALNYATLGEIESVPEKITEDDSWEDDNPETIPPVEVPVEPVRETVYLSVWAPSEDWGWEEEGWLKNRLAAFEAAHPEYDFVWNQGVCGEGDAGNMVASDPSMAGDVYFFANDQLGMLYEAGALCQLGGSYLEQVRNDNVETLVNTVTYIDGGVYGFPMTNNTWFMYYNKDTYTEDDIKTMDGLLAKGTVAMQMRTGWYSECFFTANGCTLFGSSGNDASAGIQFGGQAGYEAAEVMVNLAQNPNFVDDVSASGVYGMLDGSVDAMFSGWWDYDYLYEGLGDKLGCAPLPTITIGGQQKQLKAFAGSKAIGVNPHTDNPKMAMQLAAFLASEESQLLRYEMRGITPAHKNLADNDSVARNEVAMAEMAVIESCSVVQPSIPEMTYFWAPMGTFGACVMNGDVNLENYKDQVDLFNGQLNSDGL